MKLTERQIVARMENIMRYHKVPDAELLDHYGKLSGEEQQITEDSEIVDIAAELIRRGYSEEVVFSYEALV